MRSFGGFAVVLFLVWVFFSFNIGGKRGKKIKKIHVILFSPVFASTFLSLFFFLLFCFAMENKEGKEFKKKKNLKILYFQDLSS